jgi:hypothetical protein
VDRQRCWTCSKAGRDPHHHWLNCEFAKADYRQRRGREPPEMKTQQRKPVGGGQQ